MVIHYGPSDYHSFLSYAPIFAKAISVDTKHWLDFPKTLSGKVSVETIITLRGLSYWLGSKPYAPK